MKCQDVIDHLAEYVSERLAPEQRAEMDAHFSECGPCRRVLTSAREWANSECRSVRAGLVDYVLWKDRGAPRAELHDDTAGAWVGIEQHLATCESCVRELDAVRRVLHAFDAPTIRQAYTIIQDMFKENASSAHIEVTDVGASVKFRKQGRLEPYESEFSPEEARLIVAKLKRMMDVSLAEDGEGTTSIRFYGTEFTISGSFFQTAWGEAAVLKLAEPPLDVTFVDTEASEPEIQAWKSKLSDRPGIVVLCGVQDQPLRTLRFAFGSHLAVGGKLAVHDIEEHTPKQINHITSIKASSDLKADIEKVLSSDPDVVSIGSVTDVSALGPVIDFASRGHWAILQFPDDDIDLVTKKLSDSERKTDIDRLLRMNFRLKNALVVRGEPDPGRYLRSVTLYEGSPFCGASGLWCRLTLENSARDRIERGLMRQVEADLVLRFEQCLTQEVLRCFERGRELAISERSEHYTTEHLLHAMLQSRDAAVRSAFKALGIDRRKLASAMPPPEPGNTAGAEPKPTFLLNASFCIATIFAGEAEIAPADILNAILYYRGGLASEILLKAGGRRPADPGRI